MQLTLVSQYGEKLPALASLCDTLQKRAAMLLGDAFMPYELAQIHGTIVGLEGERTAAGIGNANFSRYRNLQRRIDFDGLYGAILAMPSFVVRVGGFKRETEFGFTSKGTHPSVRSFSIQGEIAVAMGWPWSHGECSTELFEFRRSLERFGVLHKWHRHESDFDNDFFFVLGRINRAALDEASVARAVDALRTFLAESEPVLIPVNAGTLSFVAYVDSQLPLATSQVWRVTDRQLTPEILVSAYD